MTVLVQKQYRYCTDTKALTTINKCDSKKWNEPSAGWFQLGSETWVMGITRIVRINSDQAFEMTHWDSYISSDLTRFMGFLGNY